METKKIKITNRKQFELLISRMEANPAVAKGLKFSESANINKEKYNGIWRNLSTSLNSLGPPVRTTMEWQKVWADLKLKIKRKLAHNRKEVRATGGGTNNLTGFSTCEEAVIGLLSLDRTVNHSGSIFGLDPVVPSSSSRQPTRSSTPVPEHLPEVPSFNEELSEDFGASALLNCDIENRDFNNNNVGREANISRKSRQKKDDAQDMREELLKTQTNLLREINDNTKEFARYTRKTFFLQEKKHKLKQEFLVRKEKHIQDELQFKLNMLRYKKKKLDLLEAQQRSRN